MIKLSRHLEPLRVRAGAFVSIRFFVLLLFVMSGAVWCELELHRAAQSFDEPSTGSAVEDKVLGPLLANLSAQKAQRATWAYAALAGLVTISVTHQRVIQTPWNRWVSILLAVAAVFLVETLHGADHFDRRLAFLLFQGGLQEGDFEGLSAVLQVQLRCLYIAALLLGAFVLSFVAAIVSGQARFEEGGKS